MLFWEGLTAYWISAHCDTRGGRLEPLWQWAPNPPRLAPVQRFLSHSHTNGLLRAALHTNLKTKEAILFSFRAFTQLMRKSLILNSDFLQVFGLDSKFDI